VNDKFFRNEQVNSIGFYENEGPNAHAFSPFLIY